MIGPPIYIQTDCAHRDSLWPPSVRGVKPVPCAAECVPSPELVNPAVECIGAAFGDHIDDGPVFRPYSALKLLVMTRNSAWHLDRRIGRPLKPEYPATDVSLLSTPSSRKLLLRSREPFTGIPPKPVGLRSSWRQQNQILWIPRDQRQVFHSAAGRKPGFC